MGGNRSGTQTVTRAALSVTSNDVSRPYGTPNPTFTYTIAGFVNGDGPSAVSGAPSLTTTATISSPAGAYPITVAPGTLRAANDTVTLVNGTLTVTPPGILVLNAGASGALSLSGNAMLETPLIVNELSLSGNADPSSTPYADLVAELAERSTFHGLTADRSLDMPLALAQTFAPTVATNALPIPLLRHVGSARRDDDHAVAIPLDRHHLERERPRNTVPGSVERHRLVLDEISVKLYSWLLVNSERPVQE